MGRKEEPWRVKKWSMESKIEVKAPIGIRTGSLL
jgi:hypothetical protein